MTNPPNFTLFAFIAAADMLLFAMAAQVSETQTAMLTTGAVICGLAATAMVGAWALDNTLFNGETA